MATYPNYDTLKQAGIRVNLSIDARRLTWIFDGPLSSAILVKETPAAGRDSAEPYFDASTVPGTWHQVSASPMTEPKISSVSVTVSDLKRWEYEWEEVHRDHTDPDHDYGERDDLAYGPLPGSTDGEIYLLRCCGEDRPLGKNVSLVVTAGDTGRGYITIHDYVSAVHLWLLGVRQDIVTAQGVSDLPPPPPNRLEVRVLRGDSILFSRI